MITDNFKNRILKALKDDIYCFSFTVNGEVVERLPHSIEVKGKTIKVSLLLDSRDIGKITDIKILDIDKQELFETEAIYYKDSEDGVYISFLITDVVEVN